MDSFCDVPRRPPVPTRVDKFLPTPVVPEVSIICPSKVTADSLGTYSAWKAQQKQNNENIMFLTSNMGIPAVTLNQNTFQNNTSQLMKKQVRFESPVLQQRPSLTYEPYLPKKNDLQSNTQKPSLEQIYMKHVPDKNLDLSIIDLPSKQMVNERKPSAAKILENKDLNKSKNDKSLLEGEMSYANKENELPRTYREYLETQRKLFKEHKPNVNDSITDIFNYKKSNNRNISKPITSNLDYVKSKDCVVPQTNADRILSNFNHNEVVKEKPEQKNPVNVFSSPKYNSNYIDVTQTETVCPPIKSKLTLTPYHHENPVNKEEDYRPRFPINFNDNLVPKTCCDKVTQTTFYEQQDTVQINKELNLKQNADEPSNKELIKIISQQNEQLLILQKQVAMLLSREQNQCPRLLDSTKPLLEQPRGNYLSEKCVTSTQNENFRHNGQEVLNTPRKRGMSKFSIDLMTSFEVAIRPQQNNAQNRQNFINYQPKIQEITESESVATSEKDKTIVDTSLHLQEPLNVREICQSPEPTININMNDFDESDEEDGMASEIGATFYHNLMGQVNNILKKAQVQSKEDLASKEKSGNFKEKTMSRVREATLKHLKSIGVNLEQIDTFEASSNDSKDFSPKEISFAVKQLLMKYLPDEHLAKITCNQPQSKKPQNENAEALRLRPEMSFASLEYMKKYNLLPNNSDQKPPINRQAPKRSENQKILDITALKMQPKLL